MMMSWTQWTESFNLVERCNEHALTCSWHFEEGERLLLKVGLLMCLCMYMCLYSDHPRTDSGSPLRQGEEEK
jgi:hypothetical protein